MSVASRQVGCCCLKSNSRLASREPMGSVGSPIHGWSRHPSSGPLLQVRAALLSPSCPPTLTFTTSSHVPTYLTLSLPTYSPSTMSAQPLANRQLSFKSPACASSSTPCESCSSVPTVSLLAPVPLLTLFPMTLRSLAQVRQGWQVWLCLVSDSISTPLPSEPRRYPPHVTGSLARIRSSRADVVLTISSATRFFSFRAFHLVRTSLFLPCSNRRAWTWR